MRHLLPIALSLLASTSLHAQPVTPSDQSPVVFEMVEAPPDAPRPVMAAQVALDRAGFSPGVIDGKAGRSLAAAVRAFPTAHGLPVTGTLDEPTRAQLAAGGQLEATLVVQVSADFGQGPLVPDLPRTAAEQAAHAWLGYRDLPEALAERFHTTPAILASLNPGVAIAPGVALRVPAVRGVPANVEAPSERGWDATLRALAVSPEQPAAARIEVDKSDSQLMVFDANDRLVATFPATMGSHHDPLPIGEWKIQGVGRNPEFHYNPELFWDAKPGDAKVTLGPGPNGPVGVVWIDLSKPHYGIHGTPEPQTIGRTESHGCIRLTNWDAARLAQMVKTGTPALFHE